MISEIVDRYLQIRRATGCGLKVIEPLLRNFANFADGLDHDYVVAQAAIEWAGQSQSSFQRDRRLKTVIRFARYAHAEDVRHEIPPDGVFGTQPRQRPVPFIFSVDEITKLMNVASRHHLRNTLLPHTYSTLFGLLAATGLRVSEAFNLRMDDVTPDGLLIRMTKFRKTRLVPIHETTTGPRWNSTSPSAAWFRVRRTPSLYLFVGTGCATALSAAFSIPVCARQEYSVKPAFRDLVSIRFATRLSSERWRTALSSPTVLTNTCWRSRRMRAIVLWSPHYGTWKRLRICSAALPKLGKLSFGEVGNDGFGPTHRRFPSCAPPRRTRSQ